MAETRLQTLKELEKKILWLSCWTIHNANHLRVKSDGLKVGGHQASCASMVSMMTALYNPDISSATDISCVANTSAHSHCGGTREKLCTARLL
jgi:pyruvate dehydrogenase complex dehydrogenase (E1) component